MGEIVLVTEPEFSKAGSLFQGEDRFSVLRAPQDEASLGRLVLEQKCRAVVLGADAYHGPLYEALAETGRDRGAVLARFGVGHDGIDKSLAQKHGIVVTNTPGVLDASVAEHTIWLIGALARNIAACHRNMTSGVFESTTGRQLRGQTLGILGFGAIGRRVAAAAHFGFGMRVMGAGRTTEQMLEERENVAFEEMLQKYGLHCYTNDVDLLCRRADVLSIHLPATESTRHIVNADQLALMKPDCLVINTARGSVLDENALYDALAADRLGGAALDVYESEPYQPQSRGRDLRDLPNVVMTPHIGSNTHHANTAMARAALDNVNNFLAGDFSRLTRVDRGGDSDSLEFGVQS